MFLTEGFIFDGRIYLTLYGTLFPLELRPNARVLGKAYYGCQIEQLWNSREAAGNQGVNYCTKLKSSELLGYATLSLIKIENVLYDK